MSLSLKSMLSLRLPTKQLCAALLPAAVFFTAPVAFAAPEIHVGFVDMEKALTSSKAGVEAQKQYEVEVKKAKEKVDAKKGELEKLQEAYKKSAGSLNDKAKSDKQEQIIALEKDLKRNVQDTQEDLRRKNSQLVGELVKKLRAVVDEVGRSEGFTLILERGAQPVLYADTNVDITDRVVKKFDEGK